MAEVKEVGIPTYSITGLSDLELDVIKACLAVATFSRLKTQLRGNGMDVPVKRLEEITVQLWEDIDAG